MTLFVKGPMVSALVALALTGVGAVGTAHAAAPANSGVAIVAEQPPGPPHNKFHRKFRTREECERDAERGFPGRRDDWRCTPGPDRDNPWEMWSR